MSVKPCVKQCERQLIINQFKLPMELVDIIKDYCFYDVETAERIKKYKEVKRELFQEFEQSLVFQSGEDDGCWAVKFWRMDEEDEDEEDADPYEHLMIAAGVCIKCGEYEHCYSLQEIPERIMCSCSH
jgi:ferredoxin